MNEDNQDESLELRVITGSIEGFTRKYQAVAALSLKPNMVFPCLSASVFRKSLVDRIVRKYGNFVCENLPHYPDCTDVALRAMKADRKTQFTPCLDARAIKHLPCGDWFRVWVSHLVAASLYFIDKKQSAEQQLKKDLEKHCCAEKFVDIRRQATEIIHRQYSPTNELPPKASKGMDPVWGAWALKCRSYRRS